MQLLDERNHRFSVLRCDTHRTFGKLEVVSDGAFLLEHGKVGLLGVLGRGLPAVVVRDEVAESLEVLHVEAWDFALQHSEPSVGHHLTQIQRANFLRLL